MPRLPPALAIPLLFFAVVVLLFALAQMAGLLFEPRLSALRLDPVRGFTFGPPDDDDPPAPPRWGV